MVTAHMPYVRRRLHYHAMTGHNQWKSGSLWARVQRCSRAALDSGALRPIDTGRFRIRDGGIDFLVRVVAHLADKPHARDHAPRAAEKLDPFLPYDRELFVAHIGDAHLCLLNKFNVIDHHLLVVTRAFEHQESPLTPADFSAWWRCMAEYDSLGIYNGGAAAGASQTHKHLQLVPLPLGPEGPAVPMEPLLAPLRSGAVTVLPDLPFRHAAVGLDPSLAQDPQRAARSGWSLYRAMLEWLDLAPVTTDDGERQAAPYNLLVTRQWMLLVPRSQEHFGAISVNGLGYAGSLFVTDRAQLETLQAHGPMNVLKAVGRPVP
jgi:ATP adenylyltransferase